MMLASLALPVAASDPYQGYSYSSDDEGTIDVAAPQAYLPKDVYTAADLGVPLESPEDLLFDSEGNLYICDAGANAIFVFSPEMKLIKTIDSFTRQGATETFSQPYGMFLTADGELYVADYGNKRVVALDKNGEAFLILENIQSELLSATFVFQPQKVLVDSTNRIFVLSKNVNEGIMQFTENGVFLGFYGSNTVTASFLDIIWKEIMTEEQTNKLTQFVPIEYTNFSLDHKGFIYAVTKAADVSDPIRRLNLFGGDVLVRAPIDGSKKVRGDVSYPLGGVTGITGPSRFVDVTSDDLGNYYALDDKRGRVFAYDDEGNLLFVFGTLNSGQTGSFVSPSAIVYREHMIYALDRGSDELVVFETTEYAQLMEKAMELYLLQDYEQSLQTWEEIIKRNNNCDLAYYKAGYCLYRLKEYPRAMEYFKLVNAKEAYSDAMAKQTQRQLNAHFEEYVAVIAGAVLLVGATVFAINRRRVGK
jgi:hypothetical protein